MSELWKKIAIEVTIVLFILTTISAIGYNHLRIEKLERNCNIINGLALKSIVMQKESMLCTYEVDGKIPRTITMEVK